MRHWTATMATRRSASLPLALTVLPARSYPRCRRGNDSIRCSVPQNKIRDTQGRAQSYRYILCGGDTRGRSFVYISRNSICRRHRALIEKIEGEKIPLARLPFSFPIFFSFLAVLRTRPERYFNSILHFSYPLAIFCEFPKTAHSGFPNSAVFSNFQSDIQIFFTFGHFSRGFCGLEAIN